VINLCKKVLGKKPKKVAKSLVASDPTVLTRDQHPVSRKLISPNALKVLYRLNSGGYQAYLVGGGVRDILLGLKPKDFDIATNATPEQIKDLFRNCRLIGRRFRLAHIVFGREVIEVATFRGHHDGAEPKEQDGKKISQQSEHGMLLRDNIYGSIEEDAQRRDFSINALYYSAVDYKIHDFANGVSDINNRQIRMIGDPETRYREDPVRMLRAIRFATKLDMQISSMTKAPIAELAPLMANIPAARLFEEFNKLFLSGKALANFNMLREYDLFRYFFPAVDQLLTSQTEDKLLPFITLSLRNTDTRIENSQRITPAFLLAAMLWYPLQKKMQQVKEQTQLTPQDLFFAAYSAITSEQQQSVSVPKRFQGVMKDIWILQEKLARRDGKRAFKTLEHPKFRAAYDFLLLRGEIEGGLAQELASWWTDFQAIEPEQQEQMVKAVMNSQSGNRPAAKKRRKPRKKPNASAVIDDQAKPVVNPDLANSNDQ
jgi:poly(A) polymerase